MLQDLKLRRPPSKCCILLIMLWWLAYRDAYAIPSPATIHLMTGGILYPGVVLCSLLLWGWQYLWVNSRLFLLWRLHLNKIAIGCLALLLLSVGASHHRDGGRLQPLTSSQLHAWQKNAAVTHFVDLRDPANFQKIHLLSAVNLPDGDHLNDMLQKYPKDNFIVYCEFGIKSSILPSILPEKQPLQQAMAEHRVYYLPTGVEQRLAALPATVVKLPWAYARYLISHGLFAPVPTSKPLAPADQKPFADRATASPNTAPQAIWQLRPIGAHKLAATAGSTIYLTEPATQPHFPWRDFSAVICLMLAVTYAIRYRQLFAQNSYGFIWFEYALAFFSSLLVVRYLPSTTLPCDLYLYKKVPALPLHLSWVLPIYCGFGCLLGYHLRHTPANRLQRLHVRYRLQISDKPAPLPYFDWRSLCSLDRLLSSGRAVLWLFGCTALLYLLTVSLGFLLLSSVFLALPLVVDALLYVSAPLHQAAVWVRQLAPFVERRATAHALCQNLGAQPALSTDFWLNLQTFQADRIGQVGVTMGKQHATLGLFSGQWLQGSCAIAEDKLPALCRMLQNVLMLLQQDVIVSLNAAYVITAIEGKHNHDDPQLQHKLTLLSRAQIQASSPLQARYSSVLYEESCKHPTPLMLAVLNNRWRKGGGARKALQHLGIWLATDEQRRDHYLAFNQRFYIDLAYEQSLISPSRVKQWVSKMLTNGHLHLQLKKMAADFELTVAPRMQLRNQQLRAKLQQSLSVRQLQWAIYRALKTLWQHDARWQTHIGVLQQQVYQKLTTSNVLSSWSGIRSTPEYYSFSVHGTPPPCEQQQAALLLLDELRGRIRELQLQAWQLIGWLLKKLQQQLALPISLVYLQPHDLLALPSTKPSTWLYILQQRQQAWHKQQQLIVPVQFSLHDLETTASTRPWQTHTSTPQRVSGTQALLVGQVVYYHASMAFAQLAKHTILVAENLSPSQIIACRHLRAIILQRGSYLSHSAIIAREHNIALLIQYPIQTIPKDAKIAITHGNQIQLWPDRALPWQFLHEVSKDHSVGLKAQRLAVLQQHGFQVPESIVLKQQTLLGLQTYLGAHRHDVHDAVDDSVHKVLQQLLDMLCCSGGAGIIVRSSTNIEDQRNSSYAGVFSSQAHIQNTTQLCQAIAKIWHTVQTRSQDGTVSARPDDISLNIILQPYVSSQWGGVLFTQCRQAGLMHLEIAPHGSENVTQGNACTSLLLDETGHANALGGGNPNLLPQTTYQTLYRLGMAIQTLFAAPQDIEWLIQDETIWVLQSRDLGVTQFIGLDLTFSNLSNIT